MENTIKAAERDNQIEFPGAVEEKPSIRDGEAT